MATHTIIPDDKQKTKTSSACSLRLLAIAAQTIALCGAVALLSLCGFHVFIFFFCLFLFWDGFPPQPPPPKAFPSIAFKPAHSAD